MSSPTPPPPSAKAAVDLSYPRIKRDILQLIVQYLQDEGYASSVMTVQDEAGVKLAEQNQQRGLLKRARAAIADGDWLEVEKLSGRCWAVGTRPSSTPSTASSTSRWSRGASTTRLSRT